MLDNPASESSTFNAVFVGIAVVFVIIAIVSIVLTIRNATKVAKAGHDPLTLRSDLAIKLLDSDALSAKRPVEARLAEVDDLFARGVISESEHGSARAAILAAG